MASNSEISDDGDSENDFGGVFTNDSFLDGDDDNNDNDDHQDYSSEESDGSDEQGWELKRICLNVHCLPSMLFTVVLVTVVRRIVV